MTQYRDANNNLIDTTGASQPGSSSLVPGNDATARPNTGTAYAVVQTPSGNPISVSSNPA